MKIKNFVFTAFIIGLFGVTGMLQGCYKDSIQPTAKPYVWPKPPVPIDTNDTVPHDTLTVFYATDIQPVFTSNCAGCHGGSTDPNLTAAASYASLFATNMVDTINPSSSILYTEVKSGGGMNGYLPGGSDFDVKVLTWITEGAHNN